MSEDKYGDQPDDQLRGQLQALREKIDALNVERKELETVLTKRNAKASLAKKLGKLKLNEAELDAYAELNGSETDEE